MRQFLADCELDKKGLLSVSGKNFRYMAQVLRLVSGDMIQVRFPSGDLRNMTVCSVDSAAKKIILQVCADIPPDEKTENQPGEFTLPETLLFQFVPKMQKFELIVRQATECGVSQIIPVVGQYCQAFNAEKLSKNDRLEKIIREARQQSGSPVATKITEAMSVDKAIDFWKNYASGLEKSSFACVLYERTELTKALQPSILEIEKSAGVKKMALVCGAEGGISPDEIEKLAKAGVVPLHFETNILRCETAALYGIAALQTAVTAARERGRS